MQGPYTKTVGLIVPSSDVNIEATYHRFAPPGIAVATNRIALNRLSVKTLEEMLPQTEQAAEDLCHAEPDILISSSLTLGCFRDAMLQNCVEQRTGIPCITSLVALVNLLKRFHLNRLALLTPYQEELNLLLKPLCSGKAWIFLIVNRLYVRRESLPVHSGNSGTGVDTHLEAG